ncbi:SDR family oxidoreductase [Paenibacillus mendelii]|uniref:SDR family oxidoreductase n=1 Tax=Paenibacillus mendelii TaxID=206163 RepID=A0ABV6J904_9BACL|nr:SDR family oxidoreductase [Paenibacillus mendelii]MCQ6559712.1 SDR family oxidoreductase [Paenibacillus mendelii]
MATYLITGGAGFIGSHLASRLVRDGHRVKVLDNLQTGKIENLKGILSDIQFVEGSITDPDALKLAMDGVEIVFHQGAIPSVPKSIRNPIKSNYDNVNGTLQVLHTAVAQGVRRVVYAASSSVYGDSEVLPKSEMMVANPISPYAITKYTGELYCKVFNRIYGLETLSLRYFNVFGPRQDPNAEYAAVIPKFIASIMMNIPPTIHGDGLKSRDFTYVDNVVTANLLAASAPRVQGESINIGCGKRITLNEVAEKIGMMLNNPLLPVYDEEPKGDVKHSLADIRYAEELIDYKPHIDFQEGLKKTVEWFSSANNEG